MKNILCILFLAGTFAAAAQTPASDLLRHVPADADQVIDVNLGAIGSKIDLPTVINLVGSHAKNKSLSIVQHMLTSGIDLHQHMLVVQTNSNQPDSVKYMTFLIPITDSAKFAAFVRTNAKEGAGAPLHYLHPIPKHRVAVVSSHEVDAWTDKLAVLVVETPPTHSTGAPQSPATTQAKAARRCALALQGFGNTKFVTDGHFTTAFADDGDVHIWSHRNQLASFAKLAKLSPKMAQLGMLSQMAGQNKGKSESIATLRFDNGSISYRTLKFSTPVEIAATQRALGQGLNPELLAIVPPRQLIGVVSLHFDMAAVEDTIKKMPSFAMIDTMMEAKGIHIMDIVHAFKGDFMLLACRPDKPATIDSTGKKKMPSPSLYLVASITDKPAFEKIVPMIKLKDAQTADAGTATTDTAHSKNPFPYYFVQNDLVVLGKRRHAMEFFNPAPSGDPVGKLLPEELTRTNSVNAILDFHALVNSVLEPTVNSTADGSPKNKAIADMLRNLQTFQISIGAIHGDAIETSITLNFADNSKNSLTVLMNMLGSMSQKSGSGQPQ